MDLLTASRLRAYRKCARLEHLTYIDGWRPAVEPEALAFGSLWHTGLEAWWTALALHSEMPLSDALAEIAGKARDEYEQARVEELLRGYHARWHDQPYEIVGVEEEFTALLLNPDTMAASRTWQLAGKIDARVIVRDGSSYDGRHMIVEHKTTSEEIAPEADYWAKLQMDHQLSIYTIGSESLGQPPDGCIYDVLRKPMIKPLKATPVEAQKRTKDGRLYANQREADETPDEYRARLREAIEAEPDRYYQRRLIPRTESQVRDFLADAWQQGRVMHESHLAGRAPRNPDSCHLYNSRCPYWDICAAGLDPAEHPDRFRREERVNPELTEAA